MFLNTQQAAQELGISAADLEELIRDGLIPAYRRDQMWLIEQKDIERLRSRYGTRDPQELLRRIQRSEIAKEHESFGLSRTIIDVLRFVSWVSFALSIIFTLISILNRSSSSAIAGGVVALLSVTYLVAYDLMQAVFSINATLQRLALDVAEIKLQKRG